LVDLPGYGFARVSRESRWQFGQMIEGYLKNRTNLLCTFILLDARLPLQNKDLDFINWMGEQQLAMSIILTKADKLKQFELAQSKSQIEGSLLKYWEELPPLFVTSAEKRTGRDKVLTFINESMAMASE
jgi:GTP-binding protein